MAKFISYVLAGAFGGLVVIGIMYAVGETVDTVAVSRANQ
jgi:hypothetical protein